MTASDLNKLSVFHTKSLRWILRIFWPNNISKEQLLVRCRQDWMETIMRRKWRWTGHVLNRKDPGNITRTALHWIPEGKRKRGRPKSTWRRTVEEAIKTLNHTWGTIAKLAQNRKEYRIFVAALLCTGHNGQQVLHFSITELLTSHTLISRYSWSIIRVQFKEITWWWRNWFFLWRARFPVKKVGLEFNEL